MDGFDPRHTLMGAEPPEPWVLDIIKERNDAWDKIDAYEEIMKRLFILLGENNIPYPEDMKPVYKDLFVWGCWKKTIQEIVNKFINTINKAE